jgi:xanthine dehydrogenase accessory factor
MMTLPHPASSDSLSDRDLLVLAAQWHQDGQGVALAFVTKIWGSAPRQVGALLVIRGDMRIAGSVSGGCIEGEVIEAGLASLECGKAEMLSFGVADETAWSHGLSCGGEISVLVIPVSAATLSGATLQEMAQASLSRLPIHIEFDIATGAAGPLSTTGTHINKASMLAADKASFSLFYPPPRHLVLIGAVHISQHLAQMATQCGFQVSVIDPRGIFADPQRFPETTTLIHEWPSVALESLSLDAASALVTLTHNPKIDDDALLPALASDMFYIACLGSGRTHAKRKDRLAAQGITGARLETLSGPAGLDIGAKSPAEIAASILAELIQAWRLPERREHTRAKDTQIKDTKIKHDNLL